jgi:hypothetical protein
LGIDLCLALRTEKQDETLLDDERLIDLKTREVCIGSSRSDLIFYVKDSLRKKCTESCVIRRISVKRSRSSHDAACESEALNEVPASTKYQGGKRWRLIANDVFSLSAEFSLYRVNYEVKKANVFF